MQETRVDQEPEGEEVEGTMVHLSKGKHWDHLKFKHFKEFTPDETFSAQAYIHSREQYDRLYASSIEDPQGFWGHIAEQFFWKTKVRTL